MRNVNNVVALIPEWEFEKLNLKAFRFKISNGYLINPKDLTGINPGMFSVEVFKMGGMVLSESEALHLRKTKVTKPIFTPPLVEEVIEEEPTEEPLVEDIPDPNIDTILEEESVPLEEIPEEIKEKLNKEKVVNLNKQEDK